MKKHVGLVALTVSLTLVTGWVGPAQAEEPISAPAKQVVVTPLIAPEFPVRVESSIMVPQPQKKSPLTLAVTNQSNLRIDSVSFFVMIYAPNGKCRGGAGWMQKVELLPDTTVEVTRPIDLVQPGDRVVLTLSEVTAGSRTWESDATADVAMAKGFIAGKEFQFSKVTFRQ